MSGHGLLTASDTRERSEEDVEQLPEVNSNTGEILQENEEVQLSSL